MFTQTRADLNTLGLPDTDYYHLPTSNKTFDDGAHFRIEIPTVNSFEAMDALLEESVKLNIHINRVTETYGIFRHTKTDIEKMVQLAKDYGCDFVMSTGPRATYDTGASSGSIQGKTIGYRLRGQEQVVRAIEDIKRGIKLGVTNFLIYDEGLLWVLNEMKNKNMIPNVHLKVSAHCGQANPASLKVLEMLGANSINPARDLQLPMIAALRGAISIPIDCHTDNPVSSGGFIRVYEAPEIVRIASPVYLKTGNSVVSEHGCPTSSKEGIRMAKQASIVIEMVSEHYPEARQSTK